MPTTMTTHLLLMTISSTESPYLLDTLALTFGTLQLLTQKVVLVLTLSPLALVHELTPPHQQWCLHLWKMSAFVSLEHRIAGQSITCSILMTHSGMERAALTTVHAVNSTTHPGSAGTWASSSGMTLKFDCVEMKTEAMKMWVWMS